MKSVITHAAPLALMLALVAACDSTPAARNSDANDQLNAYFGGGAGPGGFQVTSTGTPSAQSNLPPAVMPGSNDPALDWADPCTANLDEINGALLVYYGLHKTLPPTLDQIPKVSPSGERISLTCPTSGKRYVYYPEGLKPPVLVDQHNVAHSGNLLILYDAEPSHEMIQHLTDGKNNYDIKKKIRFGIVMEPRQAVLGQPVQMYVVPIEQNLLDMYLRNAEQSVPAPMIRPVPRG